MDHSVVSRLRIYFANESLQDRRIRVSNHQLLPIAAQRWRRERLTS